MRIEVETGQARAVANAMRRAGRESGRILSRALSVSARAVARRARALIRRRGADDGRLPAGAPPRSRTGALARSIRVRRARGGLSYRVESREVYAKFLETGTTAGGRRVTRRETAAVRRGGFLQLARRRRTVRVGGGTRMPPHPFLTSALEAEARASAERIGGAIREILEQAARGR